MKCTKNIDWVLLDVQRETFRGLIENPTKQLSPTELDHLKGIEALLDDMSDENFHNNEKDGE